MIRKLKTLLVSQLPLQWSLPIRFLYNRLTGRLEPEISLLPSLVRPGSRVIDVGANIGFYAYALARLGVRVECFEPVPACIAVIRDYASPRITTHEIALSDAPGQAQLHVPEQAGRLATAQAHLGQLPGAEVPDGQTLNVQLATLDSFGFDDVSLIKIDVEGHELAVLRGARETILRDRPVLIVEIEQRHLPSGSMADVFAFVEALGYAGSFLRSSREHPLSDFNVQKDQLDRIAHLTATSDERGYVNNFIFRPR